MSKVNELIAEIQESVSQVIASQKDELRVMQAMLNDKDYVVGVYSNEGKVADYCPSLDARSMVSSVISSTTKITKEEASELADAHQFSKSEAESFINIGKEFILSYAKTGRKIPLGKREDSDAALYGKVVKEKYATYPKQVGVDEKGEAIYEVIKKDDLTPEHRVIRASSPCPSYIKSSN